MTHDRHRFNLTLASMAAMLPPKEADQLIGAGRSRLYSDVAFTLMPFLIGIPQFVLNVFVVLSVVLVTVNRGRGRGRGRGRASGRVNQLGKREENCEGEGKPVVNAAISRYTKARKVLDYA